jgi:hypothetical protein
VGAFPAAAAGLASEYDYALTLRIEVPCSLLQGVSIRASSLYLRCISPDTDKLEAKAPLFARTFLSLLNIAER